MALHLIAVTICIAIAVRRTGHAAASRCRASRRGLQLRAHAFVKQGQDNRALNDGIAKFYDESSGLWEDM